MDLKRGDHHSRPLQRAWGKYGPENFVFEIIESISDRGLLISREQAAFDALRPEYNACKVAGSTVGVVCSDETRAKLSRAHKGRSFSEETRKRISQAQKSRYADGSLGAATSARQLGRKLSEETKKKLSEKARGAVKPCWTEERRVKTIAALKKVKGTPEARAASAERTRSRARFNSEQVADMRLRYASGETQSSIAQHYGIIQPTVWAIVNRKSYAHFS